MSQKTNPLVWVAVGCGALALLAIGVVVAVGGFAAFKAKQFVEDFEANPSKVAAEMIVRADPNLDLVSSDDEAGTFTVLNVKEDKEYTISFEDLAEGRVSWTTDEGEFSLDASEAAEGGQVVMSGPDGEATFSAGAGQMENIPDWVPLFPNASKTESSFAMSSDEVTSGILAITTDEPVEAAAAWYEEQLEGAGYEVTKNTMTSGGKTLVILNGQKEAEGRTVTVSCAVEGGKTHIGLQYNGKP